VNPTIEHDRRGHRFVAVVEGREAYLDYAVKDEHTLDFRRTYVPPALRGGQLARQLVAAGFAYAKDHGLRVIPSCSYVQRQVERTEEYRDLIAE
jgi:predicted GNAT family acetyltransferase